MLDECAMRIIAQKLSFTTESNFVASPNANVIIPNKSVKPNDIFSLVHKYRVITNECRGFNNLSYKIHL